MVVGTTATATGHSVTALATAMQLSARKFKVGPEGMEDAMTRFIEAHKTREAPAQTCRGLVDGKRCRCAQPVHGHRQGTQSFSFKQAIAVAADGGEKTPRRVGDDQFARLYVAASLNCRPCWSNGRGALASQPLVRAP